MSLTPGERTKVLQGIKKLDDFEERLEELEKIIGNFKDVRAARAEAEAHIEKQRLREEARKKEEERKAREEVALKEAEAAELALKKAKEVLECLQGKPEGDKPKNNKKSK